MRNKSNTFIIRLTLSDNAIIKVFLGNMVAREKIKYRYCDKLMPYPSIGCFMLYSFYLYSHFSFQNENLLYFYKVNLFVIYSTPLFIIYCVV